MLPDITLSTAAAQLVTIAAGLVTISEAWKLINKHLHPEADLRPSVTRHDEMLDKNRRRLDKHDEEMKDFHQGVSVICQTQLALLNHEISGTDIECLHEARNKLNEYLVNR